MSCTYSFFKVAMGHGPAFDRDTRLSIQDQITDYIFVCFHHEHLPETATMWATMWATGWH